MTFQNPYKFVTTCSGYGLCDGEEAGGPSASGVCYCEHGYIGASCNETGQTPVYPHLFPDIVNFAGNLFSLEGNLTSDADYYSFFFNAAAEKSGVIHSKRIGDDQFVSNTFTT